MEHLANDFWTSLYLPRYSVPSLDIFNRCLIFPSLDNSQEWILKLIEKYS